MSTEGKRLLDEAKGLMDQCELEGRALSGPERSYVSDLITRAKAAGGNGSPSLGELDMSMLAAGGPVMGPGPGDRFVASQEYKRIKDPGGRGQQWSTGPIEVSSVALHAKGTLLESGVGGPGGGAVPPLYQSGVVSKLFEPLGVADVFGSSTTTAGQVRYVVEGTATSAAAGVAEAGTKPESTLAMSEVIEPLRKIATVLPVSDELLEDAPSMQSYLNSRLSLFVKLEEERQLLRGAGGGSNELVGTFGRSGINTYTKAAGDDNATALAKVIANTAGSAFLAPDTVILHPTNWLSTRLLRDGTGGTAGQFFGGGPFTGAYGNGGAADAGMFGAAIWNTRVVLSTYVGAGTAVVCNFAQAAHILRRGGVTVDATNSHGTMFVQNLNMLRAEERIGLGVYRPVAFTEVRGLA